MRVFPAFVFNVGKGREPTHSSFKEADYGGSQNCSSAQARMDGSIDQ